jgi:hypothetical protein
VPDDETDGPHEALSLWETNARAGARHNHQNPLRTWSAGAAADIVARILRAWERHPRRFIVESSAEFLDKAARALDLLRGELRECCQGQVIPALRESTVRWLAARCSPRRVNGGC